MATRRHKIARSALRRVKRRNSKNTKLRTLRSRKNTTEKKRLNMREMRGGGDEYKIYMVYYGNIASLTTNVKWGYKPGLLGTLCYYPVRGDWYFCGYNDINMVLINKIICKLCDIVTTSAEGKKLKAVTNGDGVKLDEETGLLMGPNPLKDGLNNPFGSTEHRYGYRLGEGAGVYCCFILNNQRVGCVELSFVSCEQDIEIEWPNKRKVQDTKYKNKHICCIPKLPPQLGDGVNLSFALESDTGGNGLLLSRFDSKHHDIHGSRKVGITGADYAIPSNSAVQVLINWLHEKPP
jgi:hypothetical protein